MRLVKAAKASPHAKFYNLSTASNPLLNAIAANKRNGYVDFRIEKL